MLKALGVGDDLAHTSIRFGLGRFNTEEEVDYVAAKVIDGQGLTFTVLFPRQAGKNELSAQLEAFLLFRYQEAGGVVPA